MAKQFLNMGISPVAAGMDIKNKPSRPALFGAGHVLQYLNWLLFLKSLPAPQQKISSLRRERR